MKDRKAYRWKTDYCSFFEKEVSERCEKAGEDGWQSGKQAGIYDIINDTLYTKYGAEAVPKRLTERIEEINYYPALEEIQRASWMTPSLDAFEQKLAEIVSKYQEEIQEIRR